MRASLALNWTEAVGDVASERAKWQLVEMPREARLNEGAQRGKRELGSPLV